MFQYTVRFLLIAACSISGFYIASQSQDFPLSLLGLLIGLLVAIFVIKIEQAIRKLSLTVIFGGVIGTIVGLLIAYLFACGLKFIPSLESQKIVPWESVYVLLTLSLGYLGLVLGSSKSGEFNVAGFGSAKSSKAKGEYKILDTSVIIDGRIADICETGFVDGAWIVPRFVLGELQQIADSSDPMKRSRGRRGLDILNRMQKMDDIKIDIVDHDFPKLKNVDEKLVALAKKKSGKIVTNDYNLNKVAELQGIKILNVNELANALKPLVLPGEVMTVKVIKEGKEHAQGIAYLDDGTMVVVDNGGKYIGKNLQVVVTSVLQTAAGRMIFSSIKQLIDNNSSKAVHHA